MRYLGILLLMQPFECVPLLEKTFKTPERFGVKSFTRTQHLAHIVSVCEVIFARVNNFRRNSLLFSYM